jgi:hypothetical protein
MRRGQRILPQYSRIEYQAWWRWAKVCFGVLLVGLAMFTGVYITAGGTQAIGLVGTPIGIMAAMCLWLLPDVHRTANPPFYKLMIAYVVLLAAWPGYVAIALPGLPWITPARFVLGIMLAVMALQFAQFPEVRQRIRDTIFYDRLAVRLYVGFWITAIVALPFAPSPSGALSYGIMQEVLALSPGLALAWVLSKDIERLPRILLVLSLCCILTMVVAVVENIMQQPPWMNYIPSFMMVDQELLTTYLSTQARTGDRRYRIRSTFGIVLYYSQYLCILLPVLTYHMLRMRGSARLLLPLLVVLILHTVWYANARTASLALLLSLFGSAGLVLLRTLVYRRSGDPFKTLFQAVMLAAVIGVLGVAIASSHRAQMYTIGGDQHAASNLTRDRQWNNTWDQLVRNPIGVGLGNSPTFVGTSGRGQQIVDSLYINMLVDVGPIGFMCFFGFYIRLAWLGLITYIRARDELDEMAGPITLGLIGLVVSAYVISFSDNNYIGMMFGVAIYLLHRRQQQAIDAEALASAPQQITGPGRALVRR